MSIQKFIVSALLVAEVCSGVLRRNEFNFSSEYEWISIELTNDTNSTQLEFTYSFLEMNYNISNNMRYNIDEYMNGSSSKSHNQSKDSLYFSTFKKKNENCQSNTIRNEFVFVVCIIIPFQNLTLFCFFVLLLLVLIVITIMIRNQLQYLFLPTILQPIPPIPPIPPTPTTPPTPPALPAPVPAPAAVGAVGLGWLQRGLIYVPEIEEYATGTATPPEDVFA